MLLLQLANYSANAAEKDARDTEEADKTKNVAVATYKAAQAAMRAQEAAEAASHAEQLAREAAEVAAKASTVRALDHSLAAAQAFNQVDIILHHGWTHCKFFPSHYSVASYCTFCLGFLIGGLSEIFSYIVLSFGTESRNT